jgi:hypothetical protein
MRYDFDGYGYKYIDSGSGSDWQTRIKDAEPVYTTPPSMKCEGPQQRTWERPWASLTDDEFEDIEMSFTQTDKIGAMMAVEAKLKEKNT